VAFGLKAFEWERVVKTILIYIVLLPKSHVQCDNRQGGGGVTLLRCVTFDDLEEVLDQILHPLHLVLSQRLELMVTGRKRRR
jgi:hypothetical protein